MVSAQPPGRAHRIAAMRQHTPSDGLTSVEQANDHLVPENRHTPTRTGPLNLRMLGAARFELQ